MDWQSIDSAPRDEGNDVSDQELIAKVERADHGSFELEREIWRAVIPDKFLHDLDRPPSYTVSVDAAMRLLPESWHVIEVKEYCTNPGWSDNRWFWRVMLHSGEVTMSGRIGTVLADAKTFPLAFCAAALKARANTSSPTP